MIIKVGEGRYFDTAGVPFTFNQTGYQQGTLVFVDTHGGWEVGSTPLSREDFLLMLADIDNAIVNDVKFIDVSDYPIYHRPAHLTGM